MDSSAEGGGRDSIVRHAGSPPGGGRGRSRIARALKAKLLSILPCFFCCGNAAHTFPVTDKNAITETALN